MPDARHEPVPASAVPLRLRAISHACWDPEWPLGHLLVRGCSRRASSETVRTGRLSILCVPVPGVCPGRRSARGVPALKDGAELPLWVCLSDFCPGKLCHGRSHPYSREKASTAVPDPKQKHGNRHCPWAAGTALMPEGLLPRMRRAGRGWLPLQKPVCLLIRDMISTSVLNSTSQ